MASIVDLKIMTLGEEKWTRTQLDQIQETVKMFRSLSRKELAATLCETLEWSRYQKRNKIFICFQLLAELEELGVVQFSAKPKIFCSRVGANTAHHIKS